MPCSPGSPLAAAQNPCALECRRQTCSSLNHSFSCEELSGFGCDCVSRCGVLKPHAHSRSRASHTDRRPRTLTGGLLRRRAGSLLAAAVSTSTSTPRVTRAPGGAPPPPVAAGPASPPVPPTLPPSAPMVHSEVSVAQDLWPSEVEWELTCDGLGAPIEGGAPYAATHALPLGASCALKMVDAYGDGWQGAYWSAPAWTGNESYSLGTFLQGGGCAHDGTVGSSRP